MSGSVGPNVSGDIVGNPVGSEFAQHDPGSKFAQHDPGSKFAQHDPGSEFAQHDSGSEFAQHDPGSDSEDCDCVACDLRDFVDSVPRYARQPANLDNFRPWHAIREILISRRLALGLSQAELAARLGLTQSAISQFESLHTNPKLATVGHYASALELRLHFRAEELRWPDQPPSLFPRS